MRVARFFREGIALFAEISRFSAPPEALASAKVDRISQREEFNLSMNTYHNHDRILEESRDDSPWAPGDSTTRRWKIKAIHYWIILLVALLVLLLRAKLTGEPSKPEDHPATLTTPPPISLSLLDDCHQTRVAHSLGPDEIPMGSHNRCEEKGEVSHVRGNF